jgi:anti-sigma factor RsiW
VSGHLDAETIGDLDEGLLPPAETTAAEAHLATCPQCQTLRTELLELRTLLAQAPAVGPMPPEVASALDAALAAEARRTPAAAAARGAGAGEGATVMPLQHRRRRPRGTALLQAAAALVLVGGLGAVVVGAIDGDETADTQAAMPHGAAGGSAGRSAESVVTKVTATGRRYTRSTLATDASRLLQGADYSADGNPAAPSELSGPATTGQRTTAQPSSPQIEACGRGLGDGRPPLAVDVGSFEGAPALVYVFAVPEEPSKAEAYVVDLSCTATSGTFKHVAVFPR